MRDEPLLLVLDEPTAALDAETEHALFERYAAARARATATDGRITILVSHRFSTVRMADLIVVLDGARVVEVGTHDELMASAASTPSSTASRPPRTAEGLERSALRYSLVSLKSPLVAPRVQVPVRVRLWEPMFSSFPSMTTFTGFPRSSLESASR